MVRSQKVTKAKATKAKATKEKGTNVVSTTLTEDLMGIVGKPYSDKTVKAVLKAAGLPLGKDEQAALTLGVSYHVGKHVFEGTPQVGVHSVAFHMKGETYYVGGPYAKTAKYAAYKGTLPHGLEWLQTKPTVRKKVGKPTTAWEDGEEWVVDGQKRRMIVGYKRGKLVWLRWAIPRADCIIR